MIFRKPYAFLIKNFKKIHIVILACVVFIYFKLLNILNFVKEFIRFESYDASVESFSSHVGVLFYLAVIFVILACLALMVLLVRKKKPWKIYLVYFAIFVLVLVGVNGASNYFSDYTPLSELSGILPYRDIINISHFLMYPIMFLLLARILGADIKKFGFEKDKEFLELSEDDRAEFEVSFDFDKRSIRRVFNRVLRNIKYFYFEHKLVCNIALTGLSIILIFNIFNFFITHRSYKQGKSFNAGIYNITITDAYVTDKDYAGNVIEKGNKFVIIGVNVINRSNRRVTVNFDRYHLVNKSSIKIYNTFYNDSFKDIGSGVDDNINLYSGQGKKVYLIFKEDEKLKNNKFVLYYQELDNLNILRKIKLNITDISNIKDIGTYNLNKKIKFEYMDGSYKELTPLTAEIGDNFTYRRYYCETADDCKVNTDNVRNNKGKILKITFAGSDFEGEDFIDFLNEYGKIKYRVGKSKKYKYDDVKNAVSTHNDGKEVFIKLTNKEASSNDLDIICTIRNKRYILDIK